VRRRALSRKAEKGPKCGDSGGPRVYAGFVRALSKLVAVVVCIAALAAGGTLAVASGGGWSRGDSGKGQYGVKPGCGPKKPSWGWNKDCPKPRDYHPHRDHD
jgi:hypothetical protein